MPRSAGPAPAVGRAGLLALALAAAVSPRSARAWPRSPPARRAGRALDAGRRRCASRRRQWRAACRDRSRSACASRSRCASPTVGAARLRCELHDHHPASFECRRPAARARARAAASGREIRYQVRPLARGTTRFGATELRMASPLGLWQVTRTRRPEAAGARVSRTSARSRKYTLLATDNRLSQIGVLQVRRRGEGMEFHQLREYRQGDSAARHRLEGDGAHRAPHRARVRGREGPARAAGHRLRPAHGGQGRRAVALRPRAQRGAAARARGAAPGRRGRRAHHGRAAASATSRRASRWRRSTPSSTASTTSSPSLAVPDYQRAARE